MTEIKLGEIIKIKHGYAFSGNSFTTEEQKYISLSLGNFYEGGGFKQYQDGQTKYVLSPIPKDYILKKDDIVIPLTEQVKGLLGSPAFIPDNDKYILNQRVGLLQFDESKIYKRYLYYLFQTKTLQLKIGTVASGTQQRNVSPNDIYGLSVSIPAYNEQKKIGNQLILFDSEIENNNKIITELQELSELIYNYWFVQFDFPNDEGKPYKSSGGKMVWNEDLKREIPEGWEVGTLLNNPYTRLLTPGVDIFKEKIYLATADIDANGALSGSTIDYETRKSRANMQPELNTIWVAKMKNSIKRLFFTKNSKSTEKYIISTGMFGFATTDNSFEYICSYVFSDSFEVLKDKYSHGATQQSVNNEDLDLFPLIIPNEKVMKEYHKLVKDIWIMSENLNFENSELEKQRDFLLPLLMNGQVKIRDEE